MVTSRIRNLPGPLPQARVAFPGPAAQLPPAAGDWRARRSTRIASSVQSVPAEPEAAHRLGALARSLRTVPPLSSPFPQILKEMGRMTASFARRTSLLRGTCHDACPV